MKPIRVRDIAKPLKQDIDSAGGVDRSEIATHVSRCVVKAVDALRSTPPLNYSDFERDQLIHLVDAVRHSHEGLNRLLSGEQNASAVDALAIARLQVEAVCNVCFLLQDAGNMRILLRNNWKKKYIRFLLEGIEREPLPRFSKFYKESGLAVLESLQYLSFVSDEERRTIETEELGHPFGPARESLSPISAFPTPRKVIERTKDRPQAEMLKRLYFEYQFLCSFAHGDIESGLFRSAADLRSPYRSDIGADAAAEFYQRQVITLPIAYSLLGSVLIATEVSAVYPAHVELRATTALAWNLANRFDLIAQRMWELRGRDVLGSLV